MCRLCGEAASLGLRPQPCCGSASKTLAQRSADTAARSPGSLPEVALLGFPALLGRKELRWEGLRAEGLPGAGSRAWLLGVHGRVGGGCSAVLPSLGTLGLQEEESRPGGGGLREGQG